ncbi:unnamed protein product [Amoebophrya sp. A25]|nr:unnamed protein product [Amoebophrya sp. A25]|eukprot:GSA25T00006404001.1
MEESDDGHRKALLEKDEEWLLKMQEAQAKIDDLQTALENVKGYIKKRNEMSEHLDSLEKQLKQKDEEKDLEIAQLDRKKALEIDQLKKDMLARIRETRDSLRMKTKEQLDVITKRTIMENEQMGNELAFQRKEVEKVLQKGKTMAEENSKLRRNNELHNELEEEMARRTHVYQKLIKKLKAKLEDANKRTSELEKERSEAQQAQSPFELRVGVRNTHVIDGSPITAGEGEGATSSTNLGSSPLQKTVAFQTGGASGSEQNQGTSGESGVLGDHGFAGKKAKVQVAKGAAIDKVVLTPRTLQTNLVNTGPGGAGGGGGILVNNTSQSMSSRPTAGGSSKPPAIQSTTVEVESLRRRLAEAQDELKRFRKDHLAVLNLSDQATRLVLLELYELRKGLNDAAMGQMGSPSGKYLAIDAFLEQELVIARNSGHEDDSGNGTTSTGLHSFLSLSTKQRENFLLLLLEKLAHKRLEPRTKRAVDRVTKMYSTSTKSTQTTPENAGPLALEPPVPRGPPKGFVSPLYGHNAFKAQVVKGEVRPWGGNNPTATMAALGAANVNSAQSVAGVIPGHNGVPKRRLINTSTQEKKFVDADTGNIPIGISLIFEHDLLYSTTYYARRPFLVLPILVPFDCNSYTYST